VLARENDRILPQRPEKLIFSPDDSTYFNALWHGIVCLGRFRRVT
jgi:hypothetical protein